MDDSEFLSASSVSQKLSLVSGALQDMKNRRDHALEVPQSPGVPPAVFGAGGRM
jgi:hypothetical protein